MGPVDASTVKMMVAVLAQSAQPAAHRSCRTHSTAIFAVVWVDESITRIKMLKRAKDPRIVKVSAAARIWSTIGDASFMA